MRRGRVMMGALYPGFRQMREESPHRKIPFETSQIMEEFCTWTQEPTEDFKIFNDVFFF